MPIEIKKDRTFEDILKRNLQVKFNERRRSSESNEKCHVSEILAGACLRQKYFERKSPMPLTDVQIQHYVRGQASENIITDIIGPKIGVSQSTIEREGVTATRDILIRNDGEKNIIVELKNNATGRIITPGTDDFKHYLRQILYYLVLSDDIEKGILSIKREIKTLQYYQRIDGGDLYYRPFNAEEPGIDSYAITLPQNDPVRDMILEEITTRRDMFLTALQNNEVKHLPRLTEKEGKRYKCTTKACPYYDLCQHKTEESIKAIQFAAKQSDILEEYGVVKVDEKK